MSNVKLMWATPDADKQIAYMCRVSNPDNQDNTEFKRLLNYLMDNKHISPFEMASMCVQIDTTRDISRQILRHRSFSFQEFSQRYEDAVQVSRVFLDCVCSEFLEISEGVRGLEKVREFTRLGRAVGLGTMGFGTLLQQERIPYDGLEAYYLNYDIWKHISEECTKASQWLAKELGEPEWCKGYGLRGTHDTAQAPTKSTAGLLGGVSESTFPDVGFAFTAGSVAGELFRVPPVFLQVLKDYGKYDHATIKSIVEQNGSVQHLDFLSPTDKLVFRTAFEHDPMVNIRLATGRQKFLSQGQALNFHIPDNDNTEELLAKVMTECVLNEDILSQYYVYTMSGVTISDECTACHA